MINDALKRASQAPPPRIEGVGELRPAEQPQSSGLPLALGVIFAAILLCAGAMFLVKGWQNRVGAKAVVAARPITAPTHAAPPARTGEVASTAAPAPAQVKAPVAEAPPAPRVAAPASAPAPQKQAAPTTLAKAVVPKLKLQGIFYRPNNPSAMVNGKTLFIGDSIDGAKVTAIEADGVTMEMDGESRELTFQ